MTPPNVATFKPLSSFESERASSDAILVADSKGWIIKASQRAQLLFSQSSEELLNRAIGSLFQENPNARSFFAPFEELKARKITLLRQKEPGLPIRLKAVPTSDGSTLYLLKEAKETSPPSHIARALHDMGNSLVLLEDKLDKLKLKADRPDLKKAAQQALDYYHLIKRNLHQSLESDSARKKKRHLDPVTFLLSNLIKLICHEAKVKAKKKQIEERSFLKSRS
ncbi:MAG: hypothetical protein K0S07_947 [Chlamydiales bacterium]|nr:hypothetical protein [Chlamydiales bacterium]